MTIPALRISPSDVKCRACARPTTLATTLGPGAPFSTRGCAVHWAIRAAHREGRPPLDPRFLRRGVVSSAVAATAAAVDTCGGARKSRSRKAVGFYLLFYYCPPCVCGEWGWGWGVRGWGASHGIWHRVCLSCVFGCFSFSGPPPKRQTTFHIYISSELQQRARDEDKAPQASTLRLLHISYKHTHTRTTPYAPRPSSLPRFHSMSECVCR